MQIIEAVIVLLSLAKNEIKYDIDTVSLHFGLFEQDWDC